jgi:ferrochelatase
MARIAVVLFNLGGPDRPEAVRPFLFNLFNDPAIIALPGPLRWLVATLISRRRAPVAREIYAHIGGRSPLLELTEEQARALEASLGEQDEVRAFVAMRYWHPFTEEAARAVADYGPDEVVLLPLYPQYSTTTTGSSLAAWKEAAAAAGVRAPTRAVCCYAAAPGLVAAHVANIRPLLDEAAVAGAGAPRLLLSAHGLPESVIARGDPYQWQVERTAAAIVAALAREGLDWRICYQSRVGPKKWIGPATEDEIRRAGGDGVALVVAPIAFVSEHSETLVELDIEYRKLAGEAGVPLYLRVPALGTSPDFIAALAALVRRARGGRSLISEAGGRLCPAGYGGCPLAGP